MFRFRLFSPAGDELSEFATAAPDWHVDDEFFTAQRQNYGIMAIVPVEEPDSRYYAFFEVDPA